MDFQHTLNHLNVYLVRTHNIIHIYISIKIAITIRWNALMVHSETVKLHFEVLRKKIQL